MSANKLSIGQIILIVVLAIVSIIMMVPFIWSLVAAFTPSTNLEGNGFKLFYGALTFENWIALFENNWALYIFNTLFIAFAEIFLQLLFCSMAAYAFAKFDFYGKKILYKIMLFSMMLPGIITLIPQFIVTTSIPFFKYDYDLDLLKDLEELGITEVFSDSKADLSNLTDEKGVYIEDALHKANIEFSNDGIKASAVTAMGGGGATSGPKFEHLFKVPVKDISVNFNKPYMYFVRDKESGEVWFTGTVYEPIRKG